MEYLTSCYKSYMRLFADRPDVLVAGQWKWCPPDAKPIPYLHRFGSLHLDYDGFDLLSTSVGEVAVIPGRALAEPNPRYTGQRWCGSASVWTGGAPFSAQGTPATDPDGVPLCCQESPRRGGDQVEGAMVKPVLPTPDLWWRPEGIASVPVGDPIATWPDDSGNGHNGNAGVPSARPIRVVGPGGWPGARFSWQSGMGIVPLSAWPNLTAFMVCTALTDTPDRARVTAIVTQPFGLSNGINGYPHGPIYSDTWTFVVFAIEPGFNVAEVMSYRRVPAEVRIYRNTTLEHTAALNPLGEQVFEAVASTEQFLGGPGLTVLQELRIYAQALSDADYGAIRADLMERYGVP